MPLSVNLVAVVGAITAVGRDVARGSNSTYFWGWTLEHFASAWYGVR